MESCSDMVGLLLIEAHQYFIRACDWLEIIKIIDTVGLGVHIIGYTCIVFFAVLTLIVWRMTRSRIVLQ